MFGEMKLLILIFLFAFLKITICRHEGSCVKFNQDKLAKIPIRRHDLRQKTLPSYFNVSEEWPHCQYVVDHVQDNFCCPYCWAMATVSVISDRICIVTGADYRYRALLSVQDLVTCYNADEYNCNDGAGDPTDALDYWIKHGLPSSIYFEQDTIFRGCSATQIYYDTQPACKEIMECKRYCGDPDSTRSYVFEKDMFKGFNYSRLPNNENQIKYEISTYGSVIASFHLFDDFNTFFEDKEVLFQRHVYKSNRKKRIGMYAVKLVGWGQTDNGQKYWIFYNTRGKDWNYLGWGRFLRGEDECGIESHVFAPVYEFRAPVTQAPLPVYTWDVNSTDPSLANSSLIFFD